MPTPAPARVLPQRLAANRGLLALIVAALASSSAARPPDGIWLADDRHHDDAPPLAQQRLIRQRLAATMSRLALPPAPQRVEPVLLAWPLRPTATFHSYDYYGISNYVDHDPRSPGFVRDYQCGTRSYDTAQGYNHAGIDFFIWPLPWLMMDEEQVAVVAAAPGVIAERIDGNFDRNCAMGSGWWNAVYVRHADNTLAAYGHLKSGSVTRKAIGDSVTTGEYLGLVGSSGSSTGPHLHLELQDAEGHTLDPYHGACSDTPNRWVAPATYESPAILALSLHDAPPRNVGCGMDNGTPVTDVSHQNDTFAPGTVLHVFVAYRDHRNGNLTHLRLRRPDASIFTAWDFDLAETGDPRPFYAATAFSWRYSLPTDAAHGTWLLEADFAGTTSRTAFFVGSENEARDLRRQRERSAVAPLTRPR